MNLRQTLGRRWFRLRVLAERLAPSPGQGYPLRREWGGWTIRPLQGWRRWQWITPPLHYTRSIPAGDQEAAVDWGLQRMGM